MNFAMKLATAFLVATPVTALAAGTHDHTHGPLSELGQPGSAAHVDRVIHVSMTDNAFSMEAIEVEAGETIRFVVVNNGEFLHEFNLGTARMHQEHRAEMSEMMASMAGEMTAAAMAGDHDDPNAILLDPGQAGELIWTFAGPMLVEFACNVPGHYESGMVGTLRVVPADAGDS